MMEINTPHPSSQNPESNLSRQAPPAQPVTELSETSHTNTLSADGIFRGISTYPFHADQEYLSGLATILGHPDSPPSQTEIDTNQDLIIQAQCFYFSRKVGLPQPINVEAYKAWLSSQNAQLDRVASVEPPVQTESPIPRPHAPTPLSAAAATTLTVQPHQQLSTPEPQSTSQTVPQAEPTPPYPTSFADIVDLITQNKPVPGIEEIPTTVLELGSSKRDTATRRRKPWETADVAVSEAPDEDAIDLEQAKSTGQGVVKILQPGAIPGSGLVSSD